MKLNTVSARICGGGILCTILLLWAVGLVSPITAAPTEEFAEASETVERLHQKLLEVMQQSDTLGYQARFNQLAPVISSLFDTPLIVKVILSRYWKKLTELQKSSFIEMFNQLSIATYASRFNDYNDEQFREVSKEVLKKGRLLIKTELLRVKKEPIKLNYLMHQKDGNWLIISVIANGVNDLSLKRAEYAAVIRAKGFDGLVTEIERKIEQMENSNE